MLGICLEFGAWFLKFFYRLLAVLYFLHAALRTISGGICASLEQLLGFGSPSLLFGYHTTRPYNSELLKSLLHSFHSFILFRKNIRLP
jgi:hypothetical protein